MSDEPKTFAERFDAADTGKEFGLVLESLFRTLEKAREEQSE